MQILYLHVFVFKKMLFDIPKVILKIKSNQPNLFDSIYPRNRTNRICLAPFTQEIEPTESV